VPTNVNQIQFISHVPYDETIIGVLFKWCFEYKSPYISKNVDPNMVMFAL
jgi:hypothetical protein